eukprot:TRINITY_DN57436_c0_g1_i1.p1 TRINITY_DN57436_c0_g1~~TRINITY_DN57436_c0_g1_i1.p1  ORF type:complete len:326 (+),score=23.87 TRINITY_DN57436_c0_g1_i1:79-1056(+)
MALPSVIFVVGVFFAVCCSTRTEPRQLDEFAPHDNVSVGENLHDLPHRSRETGMVNASDGVPVIRVNKTLCLAPVVVCFLMLTVSAIFLFFTAQFPSSRDLVVACVCSSVVVLVGIGMWGDVVGGLIPPAVWFGWHPVLMTTSFMFLMVLGRYSYVAGPSPAPKTVTRPLHQVTMITAVIVMLMGYFAIFKAHEPARIYFGYNFNTGAWEQWQRILHVCVGYGAIILAVSQAITGIAKRQALQRGERAFTDHGMVGKATIASGGLAIMTACWIWPWSVLHKSVVVTLVVIAVVFGTTWPATPHAMIVSGAVKQSGEAGYCATSQA